MNDILISFLGDEYKEYIEYKGFFKKLNENLDVILYLCNNLSNDRIKNYIINSIENGDYYDNYDDLGEGISVIDENDIFEKITKGDEYNKMLDYAHKNLENISKMYSEFAEEYMNIIKYNDEKYNNEKYDLDKQKLYISDKFENIVSKLETLKIVKSKDDIKFNIILIDKESFIDYKAFKRLFKNLHIQEKSNIGNDKILLEFKEKLAKIYNLIFIDLTAKFNEYNLDVEQLITETKGLVKLLKN
jgi:hypothetical protein